MMKESNYKKMRNKLLSNSPYTCSSSSLQKPSLPPLPLPPPPPNPSCKKTRVKRGPWTPQEDSFLTDYINKHGEGRWRTIPKKAGLLRCGKSCRLRWKNYLQPSVKRGHITPDEEDLILRLHRLLGNRWSLIAGRIPGRTDNEIKNYWNTHVTKKLISQGIDPRTHKPLHKDSNTIINHNSSSSTTNNSSHLPIEPPPINYAQNNDVGKQIITSTNDDDVEDEDDEVEEEDEDDVFSSFLNSLINEDEDLISPANNPNYLIFNNDNNNNINHDEYDQYWDAEIMDSTFSLINGPNTF